MRHSNPTADTTWHCFEMKCLRWNIVRWPYSPLVASKCEWVTLSEREPNEQWAQGGPVSLMPLMSVFPKVSWKICCTDTRLDYFGGPLHLIDCTDENMTGNRITVPRIFLEYRKLPHKLQKWIQTSAPNQLIYQEWAPFSNKVAFILSIVIYLLTFLNGIPEFLSGP